MEQLEKHILDCHAHVFPVKVAAKAVASIGDFYQLPMRGKGTLRDYRHELSLAGISHAVIFSTATRPEQVDAIHRFMASCVRQQPGLFALGTVHPSFDEKEIESVLSQVEKWGFKGIKLHPDFQSIAADDPFVIKLAHKMPPGMVLLLHAGDPRQDLSHPKRIRHLAEQAPHLSIIAAHLGGWGVWPQAADLLSDLGHVFVDTSSTLAFLPPDEAVSLIRRFGRERVLFGSDYPMWRPEEERRRFLSLPLTADEQEAILWENGRRLFGIR